jgi:exportin-7
LFFFNLKFQFISLINLKYWASSERLINKTLSLLNDLCIGYSTVRKLKKLDSLNYLLSNHTSENFPFLGFKDEMVNEFKFRTTFYTALGRLINLDFTDDDNTFERFILPLSNQLDTIGNILSSQSQPMSSLNQVRLPIIGLARDLRGLTFAFNSRAAYMQLFDWIYPRYLPLFTKAIEIWYHDPNVTTPILKLMAELVQNRSQRLTFEISSPNGILLFREASRLVCTYGSKILTVTFDESKSMNIFNNNESKNNFKSAKTDQIYSKKLKGVSICFSVLNWSLSGGYVNFGVFSLYNDPALNEALQIFIKLLLSLKREELIVNYFHSTFPLYCILNIFKKRFIQN